jgi:predicted transcriptional regulator YdeE
MDIVTQDKVLNIIGIELRTTNNNNQAFTDIPPFWQNFFSDDIAAKIPHKLSDDIYAVYTKFDNEGIDNTGMYSLIIGYPVNNLDQIPASLVSCTIPKSSYRKFAVNSSKPEDVGQICNGKPEDVGQTWQEIWQLSATDKEFNAKKSYIAEFEHYASSGKINIYIGLKG